MTFTPGAVAAGTSSFDREPEQPGGGRQRREHAGGHRQRRAGQRGAGAGGDADGGGHGQHAEPQQRHDHGAPGTFTTTLKSTYAQLKALTATLGAVTLNANATFTASGASVGHVEPGGEPEQRGGQRQRDGGADGAGVADAQGNPVPGVAVSLAATGSNNTLTPASGTTNASGVFNATLASTSAQAKTVTASFAGTTASTKRDLHPGRGGGGDVERDGVARLGDGERHGAGDADGAAAGRAGQPGARGYR